MATNNNLTTFQGPINENSQINSTLNPNSLSGSQSNLVNDSSLVPPNNMVVYQQEFTLY